MMHLRITLVVLSFSCFTRHTRWKRREVGQLEELERMGWDDSYAGSVAHGMLASRTLYAHQASGPFPPWGSQLKFESAQYVCLAAFLGWSVWRV